LSEEEEPYIDDLEIAQNIDGEEIAQIIEEPEIPRIVDRMGIKGVQLRAEFGDFELSLNDDSKTGKPTEDRDGGLIQYQSDVDNPRVVWLRRQTRKGVRNFVLPFTDLTTDELVCIKEFFTEAVEMCLPISEEADRKAIAKLRNENVSNKRLFTPIPTITRFDGTVSAYMQGLRFRPEAVEEVPDDE
jgi:hypothetical protein